MPSINDAKNFGTKSKIGWLNARRCPSSDMDITTIATELKLPRAEDRAFTIRGAKTLSRFLAKVKPDLTFPKRFARRQVEAVKLHGRLTFRVPKEAGDKPGPRWRLKSKKWIIATNVVWDDEPLDKITEEVRALCDVNRHRVGWLVRQTNNREWRFVPQSEAKLALLALGHTKADAEQIQGRLVVRDYMLVNKPFEGLESGPQEMNFDGAQYGCKPADSLTPHHWVNRRNWDKPESKANTHSIDEGYAPTWLRINRNCGQSLDEGVRKAAWCAAAGITCGADYLMHWQACLFQCPFQPLPYLFFFGQAQNSGKSSFHEAMEAFLIRNGCVSAKYALTNQTGFNGELAGKVLGYCEELDLSKNEHAAARIKEWVTSPFLMVRRMHCNAYQTPNTIHFVQTANDPGYCLIEDEDTRIVAAHVPALDYEIPKFILHQRLEAEAPNYLRMLLDLKLPPIMGRLRLQPIHSAAKDEVIQHHLPPIVRAVCELTPPRDLYFDELSDLIGQHRFGKMKSVFKALQKHHSTLAKAGIRVSYDTIHTYRGHALKLEKA